MKCFQDVYSMDELRGHYKKLLFKHHPDNGEKVSDMQEINVEYDLLFDLLKAVEVTLGGLPFLLHNQSLYYLFPFQIHLISRYIPRSFHTPKNAYHETLVTLYSI